MGARQRAQVADVQAARRSSNRPAGQISTILQPGAGETGNARSSNTAGLPRSAHTRGRRRGDMRTVVLDVHGEVVHVVLHLRVDKTGGGDDVDPSAIGRIAVRKPVLER